MPFADFQRELSAILPKVSAARDPSVLPADLLGDLRGCAVWTAAVAFVLYEMASDLEIASMTHQQRAVLYAARERIAILERDAAALRAHITGLEQELEELREQTPTVQWRP